jgi:hypothetical protein
MKLSWWCPLGHGNTVYPYGSIDTNFDPPQFLFDSTFKEFIFQVDNTLTDTANKIQP